MKKIIFTEEQKIEVLKIIIREDRRDRGTYKRTIVEETGIPLNIVNKIVKNLKEEKKISSSFLTSSEGDGGYFGRGYMSDLSWEEENTILPRKL